ncbi:MAG TPA: ABC transporter substrate-binding protein, partial [Aggregatilineales bacterium]|nr:ABC transporter substrate-binding protein [Aggregatilineales bacterium]
MRKAILLLFALVIVMNPMMTLTAQDDPIVIGWVIDESGEGAAIAESQIVGVQIALEQLNEAGGILGRPVQVIRRDAALDAAQGATIAREFALEDEVDFLL